MLMGFLRFLQKLLGNFAGLRKASINIVLSVCLSARMEQLRSHWTDFYEILVFENFSNICWENSSLIKIWQEWLVLLHEDLCQFMIIFTALNQQKAQHSALDMYIIVLSIPTCFNPHGIIIREQVSNNIA